MLRQHLPDRRHRDHLRLGAHVALFVLTWFVLSQTALGRHVYAVGNNPEAARLTGIRYRAGC